MMLVIEQSLQLDFSIYWTSCFLPFIGLDWAILSTIEKNTILVYLLIFMYYLIKHVLFQDVNDEAPQFESQRYIHTISEAASIGTSLLTVSATDQDSGENAHISYRIQPGAGMFIFATHWDPACLPGIRSLMGWLQSLTEFFLHM